MADAFYPFVGEGPANIPANGQGTRKDAAEAASQAEERKEGQRRHLGDMVDNPARIAVFDDPSAAPRVVVVQPSDVRSYLEEVTATVTRLSKEQGGRISFSVIREVVENFVHAHFSEPTISILDGGNTIRFSDQGPGIREKDKALEYGTTSATEEMKRYIRGVGSGLPYAQQYMRDHGGDLIIEDNISGGAIVTLCMPGDEEPLPTAGSAQILPAGMVPGAQVQPQVAGTPTIPQVTGVPATPQGLVAPAVPQVPGAQPAPTNQAPMVAAAPAQAWGQPSAPAQPQQPGYQAMAPQAPYPAQMAQPGYGMAAYPPQAQPQQAQPAYPQQVAAAPAYYYQQPYGAPTNQQQPVPMPQPQPVAMQPTSGWAPGLALTERGREAIAYLTEHESVGPTELAGMYGSSLSTWTRELKRLEDQGLLHRSGQKRFLTDAGRAVAASLAQPPAGA